MSLPLSRQAYAAMYGPTVGDRVRLSGNGWIDGPLDEAGKQQALGKLG